MFTRRSGLLLIVALSLIVSIGSAQPIETGVNFLVTTPVDAVTGESTITMATVRFSSVSDILTLAPGVASPYIAVEPGTHTVTVTVTENGNETTASFEVSLQSGFSTIMKHLDAAIAETQPAVANQTSLRELLGLSEADMLAVVPGGFHQDYTAFIDGDTMPLTKLPNETDPGYTAFGIPSGATGLLWQLPEGDEEPRNLPIAFIEGASIIFRPVSNTYVNYSSNKSVSQLAEWFNARPGGSPLDTTHFLQFAEQTGFLPQLTQTDRHNFNLWTTSVLDIYPEGTPEYEAIFGDPLKAITTVSDSKTYTMTTAPWLDQNTPYVTWANGQPQYVYLGDPAVNPIILLSVQATGGGQVNQVNFLDRPPGRVAAGSAQIEPIAVMIEDRELLATMGKIQYNFLP